MKTTVQKAYVNSARALLRSDGQVYVQGKGWIPTPDWVDLVDRQVYATWHDVPSSWVGGCPYWR